MHRSYITLLQLNKFKFKSMLLFDYVICRYLNVIGHNEDSISEVGRIVEDIRVYFLSLILPKLAIYVFCETNGVAHRLVTLAMSSNEELITMNESHETSI